MVFAVLGPTVELFDRVQKSARIELWYQISQMDLNMILAIS